MLSMPEKNFKGEDFSVGAMARGISADGSVIYGTTWDNSDGAMIYWKDGKVKYVGEDVHEIKSVTIPYPEGDETFYYANGIVSQAEIYKMSPSGNWIAGAYQEITVNTDDYSTVASSCPAFYNTETETTVVLEEYSGAKGVHVTDGGIAFIGTAYGRRRSVRPQCGSCHRNGSRMGLQRIRPHHSVGYLHQKRFAGRSGGARYGYGTAGGYEGENLPVVHHSSGTITKNSFHNFYIRLFDRWLVRGFVRYPSEGGYPGRDRFVAGIPAAREFRPVPDINRLFSIFLTDLILNRPWKKIVRYRRGLPCCGVVYDKGENEPQPVARGVAHFPHFRGCRRPLSRR